MEKLICTELTEDVEQKLLLELGEELLSKDLRLDPEPSNTTIKL